MKETISKANLQRWAHPEAWKGYAQIDGKVVLEERVNTVVGMLESGRGGRYLDIGCADGTLTAIYSKRIEAAEAWGVDMQENEAVKQNGLAMKAVDLNREPLPFRDSYFDCVTMCETLEHLAEPEAVLMEMRRVLKDGGYAVISVPRTDSKLTIITLILGFQPPGIECSLKRRYGKLAGGGDDPSGHISHFTRRAFLEMLAQTGFHVEKISEASMSSGWMLARKLSGKKPGLAAQVAWALYDLIPFKNDAMIVRIRKTGPPRAV